MNRHTGSISALFFLTLFGFLSGIVTGSLYVAWISLLVGLVLGIEWVRFRSGPIEPHPRIDEVAGGTRR